MSHEKLLVLVELDPLNNGVLDSQQTPPYADITHAVLLTLVSVPLTVQNLWQGTACASHGALNTPTGTSGEPLFGTYLIRIHRWSRNLSARGFTVDDIDLFKGVGRSDRLPGAEYHRAAKVVLPGIQEWADPSPDASRLRDLKRSRHQLDAPVVAGKPFFDFASFMLAESKHLTEALFEAHVRNGEPDPGMSRFREASRFRFCRELLVAAALYYTNKYSESELSQARRHLSRWAFALRLGYERLGWQSVDNYARGRETNLSGLNDLNLFSAIRDSLDPRDIPLDDVQSPEKPHSNNADDEILARMLNSGDF